MRLQKNQLPRHVAIIMDGNGRWAENRGWPRIKGHQEGAESVRAVVRACKKMGVKYLTLYAFSIENWVRPAEEITGLMRLLRTFLVKEEKELHDNKIRLRAVGRLSDLPKRAFKELERVMDATKRYRQGTLILALSYGGRAEVVDAVKSIAERYKRGSISLDQIDETMVSESMYAPDVPDPDLLIRTSGEMRISNFLLWQLSYTELYVTDVLWPDFREEEFMKALSSYEQRHRRFGDIK